ncbi:DNA (cytosine-5)-methyltransferase CMT3-like [Castanea sativa]|uniref:DNA (cytosine-5)-methyltransferase CMT3-like n=1 Tax=Castanea sativa TaxID=21020 RepID=UPI003F64A961
MQNVIILLRVDPTKRKSIPNCDYYCDMLYILPYAIFVKLPAEERHSSCEASSTISYECDMNGVELEEISQVQDHPNPEVTLLNLYSNCGAMLTGLRLEIDLFGLYFVTRWAVNLNQYACENLKLNHPEIEVRNEIAEDFLLLLEKWEKSCYYFSLIKSNDVLQEYANQFGTENVVDDGSGDDNDSDKGDGEDEEVFEVEKILGICFGDPKEIKKHANYILRYLNF